MTDKTPAMPELPEGATLEDLLIPLRHAQQAPEWDGGKPANLQAAARDADEWLALIQRLNDAGRWLFSQPDSRAKLDGCRAALSKILCAPAQQATPEPVGEPDTVPLDALLAAERERDYWKTRARAMLDHAEGTCWHWMGDGEDHLESLVNSLPVVIRADQLRELLARPAPGVPEEALAVAEHIRAKAATPEPVGEALQFPPMPEGWPARFRCDSCDGNGEIGELVSMGHFQPPERQTCPDCGGRGWTSEEHAFNADHMREFAEAHALLTRPGEGSRQVKQHDNSEAMRLADYARGDEYQRAAEDAVDLIRQQSERIAELEAERDNLHTTMLAAAVEIQAHWDAHCDAEGYGPANLMHRLERGIASRYGYSAATLQRVEAERDQLRAEVERLRPNAERYRWLRDHDHWPAPFSSSQEPEPVRGRDLDEAIDAARTHKETE